VIGHPACPSDPPAEFATERLLLEGAEEILPTAASALPLRRRLGQLRGEWRMKSLNVQPRAFAGWCRAARPTGAVPTLESIKTRLNVLEKRRLAAFGDSGWTP
jgi:hypothetical protein